MERENLSIRYFISHLNPLYIKAEDLDKTKRIFKNINTIEELMNNE
jgi:molybdopterin-guanine dinucleotide biosynthesis protein A